MQYLLILYQFMRVKDVWTAQLSYVLHVVHLQIFPPAI